MELTKLGKYIEPSDLRNSDGQFGEDDVVGLSTQKLMITTKADLTGVNLNNYKLFPPGFFAYVPDTSRRGDKMSLAYNNTDNTFLVSSISVVFSVSDEDKLCADYLYMYFNRPEFDRYARFNSWGSARETFSWEDMCDIEINLPSITVQRKYADIYNAMLMNQQAYEAGLEDLKMVCDGYIEDLRRKIHVEPLRPYIVDVDERNSELKVKLAQGINTEKFFVSPKQVANAERNAKIVRRGQFAYNRATTRNGEKISIAYRTGEDCVVSSAYGVFDIKDKHKLIPEYLMMWFRRSEFDRYARFMSKGSAHEFFEFDDMCDVEIPIPDHDIQQDIVNIYNAYIERKRINEQLKNRIKDLCPILIKGSREEAEKEVAVR